MKVSIIMPVHNGGDMLVRCLQSISSQSLSDFEIIAVNDGSTDQSLRVLHQYQEQEPRLVVLSQENRGVSAARNLALKHAKGEFIRFVDCDDVLPPDSLAQLVDKAERQNAQLAIAPFLEIVPGHTIKRTQIPLEICLDKAAYLSRVRQFPRCFFYSALWNKLYRRDLIEQNHLAFAEDISWSEDFLFNMEYLTYIERAAVLDTPVYEYHRNTSGLTLKFVRSFVFHPVQTISLFQRLYVNYRDVCLHSENVSMRDHLHFLKKTTGC